MATMHFHIAQTGLFMANLFSHSGGPRKQFGTNSKLYLGNKVGQIRSWGSWFEAEISLFMMFRDTDSNKSLDFLLNPVCIMLLYIITVLLCKYLCIVQMKQSFN